MELLGDMLLQMNEPGKSLEAYESDLKKHPNRFNGLYGAGLAAERINKLDKTNFYFQQLVGIANSGSSNRPELKAAKLFLKKRKPLVN
jgi:tetratricopeptide (TPR) repeat protein